MTERVIVLAAGNSTRLKELTTDTHKCMLDIGRELIIERMIRLLAAEGIKEFVFVLGFKKEIVREFIEDRFKGLNLIFLYNDDYLHNNNSFSLYVALKNTEPDAFLLLDGDIVFESGMVRRLIDYTSTEDTDALLVRTQGDIGEEEMKVSIENGLIKDISKAIKPDEAYGESIGIERFSCESSRRLLDRLIEQIELEKEVNIFYEAAFLRLIKQGLLKLNAIDMSPYQALEIDTLEDYNIALERINGWKE